MNPEEDMLKRIRQAASVRMLFLSHAVRQMNRPERMISAAEVHRVIEKGKIIETYPEDPRGPSCLILGTGDSDRSIHVVCAPKKDYLAIITAYLPSSQEWDESFTQRRNSS